MHSPTVWRMNSNVEGPRHACRLLIARMVSSTLLYAVPVLGKALQISFIANKQSTGYRGTALTGCSTFRTISNYAKFVISRMLPINIVADEIAITCNIKSISPLSEANKSERERSLTTWQQWLDLSEKCHWIHRLITTITEWLDRKQGKTYYNLPQFLTDQRGYRQYLYRFKLGTSLDWGSGGLSAYILTIAPVRRKMRNLEETLGEITITGNLCLEIGSLSGRLDCDWLLDRNDPGWTSSSGRLQDYEHRAQKKVNLSKVS